MVFPYFLQFKSEFGNKELMIWATVSSRSCFCFVSIPSFFLELFLHWSPVAYWAPTDLGSYSFSIVSFCLFILFMGFSRQKYRSGLPFSSPMDHILSDLSTTTLPSWMAPQAWLSFIELYKAVICVIRLASFLWLWFQKAATTWEYFRGSRSSVGSRFQ